VTERPSRNLVARAIRRLAPPALGRDFRWLWSGSVISNIGDGLMLSAGPLLVTTVTREPLAVALAVFVQWLPGVIVGIPAGALVDRLDRRRLSVAVNLIRAGVLALLTATIALDVLSLPILYASLFVLASAETFADNAGSALIATSVPKEHLGVANSRLTGTRIMANDLVGPPLGAFLFGAGLAVPFGVDAVSTLAAAVLISRIASRPVAPAPAGEARHLRRDIVEGIRWLWDHPPVRALFLTIFFFNVTFGAAFSLYVLLAKERLGLDDVGFGFLITAGAVGGLIGSVSYPRLERRFSLATLMRAGFVLETTTHLVLATTTVPGVAGGMMLIYGIHEVIWVTTSTTVRQRAVPAALMGRVTSVYMLGNRGGLLIGSLIGGALAQQFGITAAFWFAFVGSAVLVVLMWRTLDDIANAPAAVDATEPAGP
jgi:MFS family permease